MGLTRCYEKTVFYLCVSNFSTPIPSRDTCVMYNAFIFNAQNNSPQTRYIPVENKINSCYFRIEFAVWTTVIIGMRLDIAYTFFTPIGQ